ncbi:eukaryotic translation initiation factor 2-alpha kinase [Saxophila tyrrhenica]|uniref:non-specific serine/threonine protein kinase n=1 Tax=Saxophila tyrrhenica TaxID=1690608 RepID=A0AAV9P0V8_9PEZI|nr:eukaryotic translation initiation factor 2-alpha kinase [Saxophila tyrrhenica]
MAPKARKHTTANIGETRKPQVDTIDYNEVQNDEVQALEAIFGEDFEAVEVKGAWSKTTDRSFRLKIRPSDENEGVLTLTVRLTATYPKTVPLLLIEGLDGYHDRTQKRINAILATRPKQLLGEAMIYDITNDINDALEDAVRAKQEGTLPSLEDERATAEQASTAMAQEAEEAEARQAQEAKDEEDRMLKQMVDDEIHRRESRKVSKPVEAEQPAANVDQDVLTFDTPAFMQVGSERVAFTKVSLLTQLSQSRDRKEHLAKPISSIAQSFLVAVKRLTFQRSRGEVMELEELLATVNKLQHPGLLNVLAYRIDRLEAARSELVICNEYADRGTLHDLLSLCTLQASKARQFTVEILEALDYLHRNGVAHGCLTSKTVALVGRPAVSPKLTDFGYAATFHTLEDLPSGWRAPESQQDSTTTVQRKSDIWALGVLVAQLFLGLEVTEQHSSPQVMLGRLELSDSFGEFLQKMFNKEPKKRPSPFDLLPAEFLRTSDSVMAEDQFSAPTTTRERSGSSFFASPVKRRSRHNSSSAFEPAVSRYASDFTELGRLGKGGFGEVVKARNKLDGGVYAVKKIKQAPNLLDQVISEVMVLNRLNHPYVVRYFSTWIEENNSVFSIMEDSTTETETATETITNDGDEENEEEPGMDFGYSTGGLDFVSSTGYSQVEFGEDSEEGDSDAVDDEEDDDRAPSPRPDGAGPSDEVSDAPGRRLRHSRTDSRRGASTLYIQMEYCERQTLRDLIRKQMGSDDSWRYIRQITEGLAHIHSHGIIHRDLKPDNIFMDIAGNPKIGDFGLATTALQHQVAVPTMSGHSGGDMTRSVGTTLYVAPEIRSAANTSYNDKVDMFSMGVIFYEMCETFSTAMERIRALEKVRQNQLPAAFQAQGEKAGQGRLISCLVSHKPSERPSSTELLRSDMLPVKIEDETIRQALGGLSDPRSPYHQKMMSALFSHDSVNSNRVKAMAWDARVPGTMDDAKRLRLRSIARQSFETVFRRHGAEEARRHSIFPRSDYYANTNVVQLLDASGNLLQLPYDLTLPYARQLGKHTSTDVRCSYTFGNAYRDAFTGGPPRVSEEVDFDVVTHSGDEQRTLDDVEVLKVMDELASEMPSFAASNTISFHLNDARILNAILDFCRVPVAQQPAVKEIVSKLGFHQHTWAKVRVELRKFGLPDTTLDDLETFDFRDVPDKVFTRLKNLLENAAPRVRSRVETGVDHLDDIVRIAAAYGTQHKLYIAPLGSVNAKFYEDDFLFQCVLERKSNRIVIAAGGRYDSLVKAHRPPDVRTATPGVVGVAIGLDPIINNMAKSSENSTKRAFLKDHASETSTAKRCDVLVLAVGSDAVHIAGVKLVTTLWNSGMSAELAITRSGDTKDYNFIVTVRHEASSTVRISSAHAGADETDVPMTGVVSHIQQEFRELESSKPRPPPLLRQPSHQEVERKSNVQVLMASRGSKKSNKYQIVSDAQEHWSRKLDAAKDAPILAVETRDDVLDLVQQTRLSDAESWRKAVQSVPLNDRQYVQQIREMLSSWRKKWESGDGMREACVFNFRTHYAVIYDVGL